MASFVESPSSVGPFFTLLHPTPDSPMLPQAPTQSQTSRTIKSSQPTSSAVSKLPKRTKQTVSQTPWSRTTGLADFNDPTTPTPPSSSLNLAPRHPPAQVWDFSSPYPGGGSSTHWSPSPVGIFEPQPLSGVPYGPPMPRMNAQAFYPPTMPPGPYTSPQYDPYSYAHSPYYGLPSSPFISATHGQSPSVTASKRPLLAEGTDGDDDFSTSDEADHEESGNEGGDESGGKLKTD